MKPTLLYIIFVALFISFGQPAHAGFFVKKQHVIAQSEGINVIKTNAATDVKNEFSVAYPGFNRAVHRGWFGILSVVLGLLGFLHPLFSIFAVLFGFMGMSRHNYNTGFAIVGFILGLTVLVLTMFFSFVPLLAA